MFAPPFHILMILSLLVVSSVPQWGYALRYTAEHPAAYAMGSATSDSGDMQDPLPLPPVEEQVVEIMVVSELPATHALFSFGYTYHTRTSGWHDFYISRMTSRVIVPPPEVTIFNIPG